jgi:dihydrofolate reductase
MGRKTWSSIPPKFRPLKSRQNIVLSRSFPQPSANTSLSALNHDSSPLELPSLHSAVQALSQSSSTARAFVIGGAEIYKAALDEPATKRILLTRVLGEFECDTFFPVALKEGDPDGSSGWRRISQEEMDAWVGEEVPRGVQSEAGTEYVFEMWER